MTPSSPFSSSSPSRPTCFGSFLSSSPFLAARFHNFLLLPLSLLSPLFSNFHPRAAAAASLKQEEEEKKERRTGFAGAIIALFLLLLLFHLREKTFSPEG